MPYINPLGTLCLASFCCSPYYMGITRQIPNKSLFPLSFRHGRAVIDEPVIRDILRLSAPEFIEYCVYMLVAHLVFKCGKGFSRLGKLHNRFRNVFCFPEIMTQVFQKQCFGKMRRIRCGGSFFINTNPFLYQTPAGEKSPLSI